MPAPDTLEIKQISRQGSTTRSGPRRWLPLIVLMMTMIAGYLAGVHQYLSLQAVIDARDHFKLIIDHWPIISLIAFIAFYALVVSLSLPGASLCTLAGGLMFGWLVGGLAAVVAATVGASVVFAVARSALGESLARKAGPQIARMQQGFRDNALSYMLFLRLVPAFPFFIVNIVPAVIGIPFRTYAIGTFFGILPGTLTFASIGAGLDSVVETAKAAQVACTTSDPNQLCPLKIELATLLTPQVRISFALLGLLALMPVALKYWRKRQRPANT